MSFITIEIPSIPASFPMPALATAGTERRNAPLRPPALLPDLTGFQQLSGRRIACLLDEDNLRISLAREHGCVLDYDALLHRLRATAEAVSPWAVLTLAQGEGWREAELKLCGWRTLSFPHEIVQTINGPTKKSNADMDLCFEAGRLMRGQFDTLLVGSGDGDLCVSAARGVKRINRDKRIVALSVPGASSHRLRTRGDLFDGSILIGRDLCQSM
jgi:hypothetical protein